MLVSVNQQAFDTLDDASIIWTCIEPTIQKIRGKNIAIKTDSYADLSAGQRALLMFQIMYGHTSTGVMEFYNLVPYLPSKSGIWQELKKGMQYFGDRSMLQLLSEMEKDYHAIKEKSLAQEIEMGTCINLDSDSELLSSIRLHDIKYRETIPQTIKLIGTFIRNNPTEFVQFE